MSICLLHPQRPAAAICEYCAQPHCAECLRPLLGRSYCPPCAEQVGALATGSRARAVPVAPGSPAVAGARPAQAARTVARKGGRVPGWASALLYLLGFVLLTVVAGQISSGAMFVAKALASRAAPGSGVDPQDFTSAAGIGAGWWSAIFGIFAWLTLLAILAYTTVLAVYVERRSLADIGLRWRRTTARDLLVGVALAVVLAVSVVGIGLSAGWYTLHGARPLGDSLLIALVGFLLLLPLAAVEELAMRGFVLQAISRSWGKGAGLAVSTVAFAALHLLNPELREQPLAILGLLLAGLYLGTAYLITRSLWLPIFLHTAWNLLEGPVFGLPVSGMRSPETIFLSAAPGPDLLTGGGFGPEAGLLMCVVLVVHIGALWALAPLLRPKEEPEPPEETKPDAYRAIPV